MARKVLSAEQKSLNEKVGKIIQEKRHFYNMTKTEVAKILDLQPILIDHYENGGVTIPSATLLKMCEIFQCEVKDLLQN